MVSKNNAKMVQRQMADQKQKFGIRKLSVGVASVLLGTVFYMQSGTVYADVNPVASDGSDNVNVANETSVSSNSEGMSSPSNSASSDNSTRPVVSASDAGNSTATSQVSASPVKSTASQVSDLASAVSGQESSSSASQVNVGTDNIADGDNTNAVSSSASVPNSQASTFTGNTSSEQLSSTLSLSTNHISAVNASSLLVSKVALLGSNDAVNGGFDQSTWGKLNVNDWKGNVQGDYYQLTDYTGDANHVIVPNEADFAKAGISTSGKQVGVTSDLMHTIFRDKTTAQDATVAFSKTDNKQVKAIGNYWANTWSPNNLTGARLSKFDGTNLDVSNVTNMSSMFNSSQISDLSPLANWNVSNVTDMSYMFNNSQISDLSSLANWKVNNVTNMNGMFYSNHIIDLSPLSNWKVDNVTNMKFMFYHNQISDLSPLSNWKVDNVTNMYHMFNSNQISDLSPLSNWKVDKVTDMGDMFANNQISDLSPLSNWKVDKVTDMNFMFERNQISNLSSLANWKVDNVTDMSYMFYHNQISDLSPLANWNVSNVTDMHYMFADNQISDLSSLANWNVSNVTNMAYMFDDNSSTQTKNLQAKRVINFAYPDGYTGKTQDSVTQTVDLPQKVSVELTTKDSKPSNNILDWVTKTETPETPDPVYFQDYTVPEIKGLLEPDKTVISRQQADITKPINVTVTYKLVDSNTNDAFALDSKHGLHEHANVNDNGGYDKDYWGALDVSKFTTVKNGDNLEITGYTGDASKVIIPNIADFEINGLDQGAKQVTISSSVMHDLAKKATRIGLSKTNNQKVVAGDAIWQDAFGGRTNDPQTGYNDDGGMWVYNPNLTVMDLHNLDTTNITDMSSMFNGGRNLNVVGDLSQWNTANVASMRIMFQNASSLTNIGDLSKWDTGNVTDMNSMFQNASSLTNIGNLDNWNTSKVTNMHSMFANATNLTNIGNLDNWNTSKVTDMSWMFGTDSDKQSHLTNIGDLSKWDTGNVTNMSAMFTNATNLANIGDLSKWQTGNVTNMSSMFSNATNLTNIGNLDNWNTSKVTDMNWMFGTDSYNQSHLTNIGDLSKWDTGNVTNMSAMFTNATNLANIGDLSKWQTGNVTDMNYMFYNATNLTNIGNLDNWNTGKVTNMSSMFSNATNLTNIGNLDNWNTSKVTDMNHMFSNATNLTNIGNLDNWNTSKVTNMSSMFSNATNLTNIGNLDNWNTSKVTDMSWMFGTNSDSDKQSHLTNIGDLSKWDTGNVTNMHSMFNNATNLTNIGNLDNWNTSNVTDMSFMFNRVSKLANIGDLSKWDVANVTNMSTMFQLASSLTNIGNLSKWNVSNITNIAYMFMSAKALRHLNISNWNLTKLANKDAMKYMFANDINLTVIANDLALPAWYQNEINDADYFGNNHMAVITNVPELIKSTGDIDNLKIDDQDASRSIFYDSKGSSDAVAVLKQADQDYIKQYQQTHPGYTLNLATTVDQTNPIALANAEFTSSKIPQTFKINFVDDANGQIVASSSIKQALIDTTLTLDSKALTKLIPEHYYFTDSNYSIPTSFNYQHVTDNLTIHLTKAPVYTFNLVDDTSNKTASTFVWDGIDSNHHLTGTVSDLNQKIKQAVNSVEWKNAPAGAQHGDVPKSANLVTPVTDLTALPTHDTTQTAHFTHATQPLNEVHDVSQVIHYVYQNGSKALDDHVNSVHFVRDGYHDEFSNTDHWNTWTPSETYKFDAVPTPVKTGYTPDVQTVPAETVTPASNNIRKVITYAPDAQKLNVKFIDDTTGQVLKTVTKTGVTNADAGYNTKSDIDSYKSQHYILVSDSSNGAELVFDNDDSADQAYEVHLKHGTEPTNESRIKKITVHYQYADGLARSGKAADDQTATNLTFKRTGTHDLVTGKTAWNAWDQPAQTFAEIDSPVIEGYTPDQAKIDNVSVTADSPEMTEKTIVYNADAQKLSVDFIDDTTGKTLKVIAKIGHSDESAGYSTKSDLQSYLAKHYDLVSDQTNGESLVFDHDDKADQHYEVHLTHHLTPINEQHTITETIHYQYADGLARSGKAADDYHADALKFSRTGNHDNVTDSDHWNAWTPADQQIFDRVQSPVIEGYTPDQAQIDAVTITPDSQNIEKTVTYTADDQKLTVNFIDDTTGETLKTVAKTGRSDEAAGYSTKSDLQSYLAKHYDLVSDATKGADLVFDHNDGVDQVYDVHLTHHLTPISDHQVVNETIHYVYADGLARTGKAADDYTAVPLEFNRTGKHDDVTETDSWNAWIPGSASFAMVQSPAIQGYTPDHAQIDAVSVDANSQDIVKTVTYSADQQKMTVDFIDDTDNGKVLKTVIKTGRSDEAVGYNTKADIQTFVDGHYRLDHDTSNGENLVFDHDDAVDQHYEVYLTHETTPISEATSTKRVIHYQLADGTPVAKDYTAKVNFSRNGFKDLVTNADHWNAWTPNATQTFDTVMSPAKAGYTPDHAQVDAVTVEPHHADLETTVTYSPDPQKATVEYVDDVTGKTLQTKELTGVSDETSAYTTESTIKQYVGQHYKLVSDQTNSQPVVFDHDDDRDQTFEVHLTHTYQDVSQEHQVHQTIHYQYADGKQAQPDYTAKVLAFSRTGIQDLVTENIQWNAWTPDQTFAAVNTPALNGYTPDVQTVAPVKVSHDSKDIEQTVIYHADDQTILVNYIDDDNQSTLKTDSIIGKTAQTSDYTTKKSLDQYKGQHYDVVSDDTNGGTLTFDSDSTKVQTYNVHLKHQHQVASDKSTVRQTVHYVYQDGKQAAKDRIATPIEFTRTGDTDLVTGKTTWNAWTPATGTFVAVLSPVIVGYTPSQAMINHVSVHPGDKDLDTTVTYVPDRQMIVVNYIDQVTSKTLKTDTLNSHSDQTSDYMTKSQINSYLGQHYKLISDATKGQTLIFDHDDQATQTYDVVLGHQTEAAHRTHEVHETIDYVYADGSQAAKSFTAKPLVFSQTGVHDLVTNITDWNGEWTKPQVFASVESPKITGFTASKPEVKAIEVNHQSGDVHELVIYVANAQTAQIKYIDDVTGKTLEVDGANGHFNESIVFGHNVNDQINKFKQPHYKLVSNNFDGQKYQADNTKNVYEVHLTHEYQKVHATDAVAETVKFQYADGSQARSTKTQTVNFGRDGIKDLVTGTTAWMPVDSQTLDAVDVPVLSGYTADTDQVPAVKVNFGDNDITKVVTYTANDQVAEIKIIDDTTGNVLNTQSATGKFGTEIQFKQNPDQQVIDLQAQHYELVSDNFNGQKYQADNVKNQFEIHVKHQMMDVQRTDKVTETIHYLRPDGNKLAPDKTQTITFTRHGVKDQVTDHVDWNPVEPQEFKAVKSPVIDGYQADAKVVDGRKVLFGDQDVVINVHYTKLPEQKQEQGQAKQPGINLVNTYKVTPEKPEKVVTVANGTEQKTKQNIVKNSAQSTTQDTNQLPQTGSDEQANLLSIIGGSLMTSLALFGLGKKKKHKN